jgi:predicted amidophosphoribosyltransferase
MICEKCGLETESTQCNACGKEIVRLGQYCYLCGAELLKASETEDTDFDNRVLCSDGACIGVIDEKGVCKVCGKPYSPET